MLGKIRGTNFYGININTQRKSFNLEIIFFGFPKEKKHIWANSRKDCLDHLGYSIAYATTQFFLVFVNNFEPNLVLVNVNKLKPYKYVD
jgi:hypothetical protein